MKNKFLNSCGRVVELIIYGVLFLIFGIFSFSVWVCTGCKRTCKEFFCTK